MADMNRRKWLQNLLPKGAEALSNVVVERVERHLPPRRRPPGAHPEPIFLATCTKCNDCITACPQNAIYTLAEKPGYGTPVMLPDRRACTMCTGFPCAAACTPGALAMPEGLTWKLGTAVINTAQCLPFRGPECGACGNLCPPGAEGALTFRLGRPKIDPAQCIGCGLCITACVTTPAAITLEGL
jgi:ferredoxin-type protein NapG